MKFLNAAVGRILLALYAGFAPLTAAGAAEPLSQDAANQPVQTGSPAPGEHGGPSDPKELEAFVDGVMAAEMKDKHIAGATIVYVKDNRVFLAKGYGYADVAAGKPVDPNETMFRVGSVSKLFTWTAVMQLVEQGKLDLDADINRYLRDFQVPATYPEPITLKHLLCHTPGFEDHVIGLFGHGPNDTPLGKRLASELPARVRKPGELASYSNHGSAVAGYIVQEVSGLPWEEYIEQRILQPLGMAHTTVRQPAEDERPAAMSKGYKYQRGKFVNQGFEYVPLAPAGAMSASAADIARFMIAHLQNGEYESTRILSEDTAKQMHSLLFTHDPRIEGMAYGFMRMKYGHEAIIEHGGATFAFHSSLVMLPARKSGFFVSYNTTTAGSSSDTLLGALMQRYYPADRVTRAVADDFRDRGPRYAGQYGAIRQSYTTLAKLGSLFSVANVSVDDDQLVLAVSGMDLTWRFVEAEPAVFQQVDGERMLAFRQDGKDPATHFFLGGSPVAWVRLPWYETPQFTLAIVVACVGVFFSAVIGWPLVAFIARGSHFTNSRRTAGSRLASWLGWITSLAILVVIGLAMIPFSDPMEVAFGVPPILQGLLWSAWLIVALVGGVLVCTISAWRSRYWRLSGRLHYTCLLLAGVAFVWFLAHWNLWGVAA